MNLRNQLKNINEKIAAMRSQLESIPDDQLEKFEADLNKLLSERSAVQKKIKLQEAAQRAAIENDFDAEDNPASEADADEDVNERGIVQTIATDNSETPQQRAHAEKMQKRHQMGENLKKDRTVILDSSVLIPTHQSNVLTPYPWKQWSSVVDMVNYLTLITGETFEAPYVKSNGIADYTEQPNASGVGGNYHKVDIAWGKRTITKTKITAYGEITKELERTPSANYAGAVEENITISLRKKLAREIVAGDGATGHFVGIMSDVNTETTTNGIDVCSDFKLGEINEYTLEEIILNYGGEEDIESAMVIGLAKLTLLQFSKVRGNDKKRVYTIDYANKTIDGVPFIITSSVKDFVSASAGVEETKGGRGDGFMFYGDLNKYTVAVFSNIETQKSTDFKFDQGITCFRGDVFMGGNIVGYRAFLRVYKGASTVKTLTKIPLQSED